MASKVDERVYARIIQLKHDYGLTAAVIAERLGISRKTVQVYLRASKLGVALNEAYGCTSLKKPSH